MTMKYHVASFAMVSKRVVTLRPRAFDLLAHKMTIKNAKTSVTRTYRSAESGPDRW